MRENNKHKIIGKIDDCYKYWYRCKNNKYQKRKYRKIKRREPIGDCE